MIAILRSGDFTTRCRARCRNRKTMGVTAQDSEEDRAAFRKSHHGHPACESIATL
jgi:hypothetical protein